MQACKRSSAEKQRNEVVNREVKLTKRVRTAPQPGQAGFLRIADKCLSQKRDLTARIDEAERAELAALKAAHQPQGKQPAGAVLEIVDTKPRLNELRARFAAPQPLLSEWEADTDWVMEKKKF